MPVHVFLTTNIAQRHIHVTAATESEAWATVRRIHIGRVEHISTQLPTTSTTRKVDHYA